MSSEGREWRADEVASLTRELVALAPRVTQHEHETNPNCYEEHNCEGQRGHARALWGSVLVNSLLDPLRNCDISPPARRRACASAWKRGGYSVCWRRSWMPVSKANSMIPATTGRMIQARASMHPSCPRRVRVKRQPAGSDFARTAECTGHRSMSMTTLTSSSWRCSPEGQSVSGTRRVISRCNQSTSARESALTAAR
jgi:hypothetical protein